MQHVTGIFFNLEESIVSLSLKFKFSGLRMSPVDPLSDQVPSEVLLDCLCSYLSVQHQKSYLQKWESPNELLPKLTLNSLG